MAGLWKKLRKYMEQNLRRQLVFYLLIGVLVPFTAVTSFLFIKARREMKKQAIGDIQMRAESLANQVDELLYNILSVSDTFAYDEGIIEGLEKDYEGRSIEKMNDIYEWNRYFMQTDPFDKNERLSAIFSKDETVFNLMAPALDGENVKERMLELGATDRKTLSIFQWHPLCPNFLKESRTGDVRRDQVLMGVRRIMNPRTGTWMYTQFFALEETKLYQIYRESAEKIGAEVYIVDTGGSLISSSREDVLELGEIPGELLPAVERAGQSGSQTEYLEESYIITEKLFKNAEWKLIMLVPVRNATRTIDKLFIEIVLVMAVCIFACAVLITWISRRFLRPVEILNTSMEAVYHGNLEAYVEPGSYYGEMKSMMLYYNAMLIQINQHIRHQIESERKKKELELEVLMGQINPHFLYNTLENIVWKSNEVGRPDIGRIAASLGRLYRLSIGNGETIVNIRQEVEHVMAYINIQKNRYKDRFIFDLRMNYEEILEYSIIKLTLQPVVENCFMYGLEQIDHVLKIRLAIRLEEEFIRITITDNGSGMSKERLKQVRRQMETGRPRKAEGVRRGKKGTGIALYSVKERIAIYTGYSQGLKIQSKKDAGTMVTIRIPKIPSNDKNDQ